MATDVRNHDIRNQIDKNDTRAALWAVVILAIIAVLAYAGYAAYHRPMNAGNAYNASSTTPVTSANTNASTTDTTGNSLAPASGNVNATPNTADTSSPTQ